LGLTNAIFTDSITVGGVKGGGSAGSPARMAFAAVFTNSSPTAYLRGTGGATSRIFLWGVGDTAINSGSSAQCFGNVDLSNGSVDALVDNLILGRDRNGSAALDAGVFTFTAGNINVNSLIVGDQGSASTGSAVSGSMTVNGANATLTVNRTLDLGHTTLTGATALNTRGVLNIFNGTVNASNIIVGATSITNTIAMNNATLFVTNAIATNAAGVFAMNLTNSTLGLNIADTSLKALAGTLTTGGATNVIWLTSVPVFPAGNYPAQIPLLKYTNAAIAGVGYNFGLTNVPVTAPNASLINNTANKTIDLYLPVSPAPVITSQPQPFSGSPGDSTILSVTNTGLATLSYQWYYTNGVSTNALSDGPGPSGSSTLTGSTSSDLTLASAQPGDSGGYFVIITNLYGAATSAVAQVSISSGCIPPSIVGVNNQTVIQGNNATFAASVAANPAANIQWQRGGVDITDATNSTLVVTNVQYPADDGAVFSIVATNTCGGLTNSATLTVIVPPSISTQPTNVVVTNTQAASFSVAASGVPAPGYQWYKNGNPISLGANGTATSATLNFASVSASDTATYYVAVTNAAGTSNSASVTLTVNSVMSATALSPANGATGVCYDTPLYITFSQTPLLRNAGTVKIFNATNQVTPVDTIDLGLNSLAGVQAHSAFSGDGQGFNYYPVIITGLTAAIYPHGGVLTSNQTYYVTVDNGVFTDTTGAYFIGITDTNAWRFTTKPTGPANPLSLVVNADGSGDFVTVQGAVDSVPSGNTTPRLISVRDGNYVELVNISGKHNLTLRGQSRAGTIISYANNANIAPGGSTHSRMSFKINGNDLGLENLTLTNSTPLGGAQAEALMVETDRRRFVAWNVSICSFQDTILMNTEGSQCYFQDCFIQGTTDFIWGSGNAFFTNCEIKQVGASTALNPTASTGVTSNGMSYVNCTFTRSSGLTGATMGRTRGIANGNAAILNCRIDDHIYGWATDALPTSSYRLWDFANSNLTATVSKVLSNAIALTAGDPRITLASDATNWLYGWIPSATPVILTQPVSQSVAGGGNATFTVVVATAMTPPTYQWRHAGTNLSGATSASLNVNNAHAGEAGDYTVVVTSGTLSVTSSVATLTVGNTAPTLPAISDSTVNVGVTVNFTNNATDPDVPAQSLTYSLLSAPGNATLGASSGVFNFRPTVSQGGTSNYISLYVADNGSPSLSATQSFSVVVNPLSQSSAGAGSYSGGTFGGTVSGDTGPDYEVLASTNLVDWEVIF
ncbi:MAG: hypothetical protein EPO07_14960, partial [Verrucomicrobia bacterium]